MTASVVSTLANKLLIYIIIISINLLSIKSTASNIIIVGVYFLNKTVKSTKVCFSVITAR